MKKNIKLSNDFLDKLNDDELYLVIKIVPNEILLLPIKKNPKEFKNETKGSRIDVRSKLLMDRLPNIYFDRIKRNDGIIINIIKKNLNVAINNVNNQIIKITSDEAFIEKTITSNNIDDFSKLLDIILEELKPEYIKLFLKLIDQEISDEQDEFIDKQIKIIVLKKELKEEISKELDIKQKEQITSIQELHKTELFNQLEKLKQLKTELDYMKQHLYDEKTRIQYLSSELEQMKVEKDKEINLLQNHIKKLNHEKDKIEKERFSLKDTFLDKDLVIEKLTKDLSLKYDEYSIFAYEKWSLENHVLLNSQSSIEKNCKNLQERGVELNNIIIDLENEKLGLENKILEFNSILNKFIENIDEKLIEKAFYDSILKFKTNESYKELDLGVKTPDLYIKDNEIKTSLMECKSIDDFTENIAINLENIGVKDIADEVANYIVGILATSMSPLICGYNARKIATAISLAYSGETPYIITLPNGFINSKELLEIYNSAKSNVVLIEDAIGTMNENSLMPLLRERSANGFSNKLLLLSSENMDSVKYMPENLLNQVALVMINQYGINSKDDNEYSDARGVLKHFTQLNSIENEYKIIKKLLFELKVDSPYKILRATIVAYSNKLSNSKLSIQGYLRSELMYICMCKNNLDTLEKNIQNYQLGDSLSKIVSGYKNA